MFWKIDLEGERNIILNLDDVSSIQQMIDDEEECFIKMKSGSVFPISKQRYEALNDLYQ